MDNDKAIMALPHPVRFEAAINGSVDDMVFGKIGILNEMKPYLTDNKVPTEWIINQVPNIRKVVESFINLTGGNLGSFILMAARTRLRAHGDSIFQLTPALQTLLNETDIGQELPARFFSSPYDFIYIEFTQPNNLRVINSDSGEHLFEGAYVAIYDLPAHHDIFKVPDRNRFLNLDPSKPIRLVEIVVTGSPIGKLNSLDDASQNLILFIQNEDECLKTLLERHIDFFKSPLAYTYAGMAVLSKKEIEVIQPIIFALAKVLLYINLPDSRQNRQTERTDLEKRIKLLGPKKASKLMRKSSKLYDKILIGPTELTIQANHSETSGRPQKMHWRRGHFKRIRFGEGHSEVKIGWIAPILVNASGLTERVVTKKYIVR